jgi:hypothetical protein
MRTCGVSVLLLLLVGACATKPETPRSTEFKPALTASNPTPEELYDEPYRELSETCSRIWERDTFGLELRSKWGLPNLDRDRRRILDSFRNPDGVAYLAAKLDSPSDEIGRECLRSSLAELRRDPREASREK